MQNTRDRKRSFDESANFERNLSSARSFRHVLLQTVDFCLAGVIFIAPLVMGGRHPWGKLVLVSLIGLMAIAWSLSRCLESSGRWSRTGVEWLILAGAILVLFQLASLPSGMLGLISPTIENILPEWSVKTQQTRLLSDWSSVSLTPVATRNALGMYFAYALLFIVTYQRLRKIEDVERVLRWIGISVVAMASFGIVQYLTSNGKFLWIYQHTSRGTDDAVHGSFANPNHFAHFLALGVGPAIWWRQQLNKTQEESGNSKNKTSRYQLATILVTISIGIVLIAAFLSYSRGGVAALFLAVAVTVGFFLSLSQIGKKSAWGIAGIAILVFLGLSIHGYDEVQTELETITSAESMEEISGGREKLWGAVAKAISNFSMLGAGIGSHREIYPMFLDEYFSVEFTHAENGYLQILLEAGIPGFLLLILGILFSFYWCLAVVRKSASLRLKTAVVAVFASLVASIAQSLFDFVWYIPACMSLTILLLVCAARLHRFTIVKTREDSFSLNLSRLGWCATTAGVCLLSAFILTSHWGPAKASSHWDNYIAMSRASESFKLDDPAAESALNSMNKQLEKVLQYNPNDHRANLRAAGVLLKKFHLVQQQAENAMPLDQIRNAALASNFQNEKEQDRWLTAAIGENRQLLDQSLLYTKRALHACPLQGEGYLYLAELSFLKGGGRQSINDLVDQALKVRPHRGSILFFAGREALLQEGLDKAISYWSKAFHQGPEYRSHMITMLAGQMSPQEFVTTFSPGLHGLELLYQHYRSVGLKSQAQQIGQLFVQKLEEQALKKSGREAAVCWHQAHHVYEDYEAYAQAIRCAQKAVNLAPNDYVMRRTLAKTLFNQNQFKEALVHLQWCVHRKSTDEGVQHLLDIAAKRQIDGLEEAKKDSGIPQVNSYR